MGEQSTEGEQLKLLQAALDHINQGFTVFDHDLRMVGWNERFAELLGFPEHLIKTGTPFSDFMRFNAERGEYGEGDVERLVAERVERARTFTPRSMMSKRPSGEVISVRDTPLPSGGFVTTYTDVTDQRQREEALAQAVTKRTSALRESEQRLRLITDAVPALIAHIDKDTCYTFANQRYANWFGFTVENILGRPMELVIEDDLYQELLPNTQQALSGIETTYEYARKGPDGRYAEMRSTLLPDIDEAGEVRGCFVLSLDITEQKQREAALHQAQKMEAIGQLTGGVAHDFNNLLTIILNNLAPLMTRCASDPELDEYIKPTFEAANKGANLIKRLLAFARGRTLDPRPVDVPGAIADLSRLLGRTFPSSIEIMTQVKGSPRPSLVDRSRLENAILNMAFNARDAMNGDGQLLFSIGETYLDRSRANALGMIPGNFIRVDVEDTGAGMSEETQRRAFEPFFTTKNLGAGHGLGLSTVYGFAQQSEGGIEVTSSSTKGTCLTLYLPCTDMVPESAGDFAEESSQHVEADGTGELVLLVVDDPGVRDIVRRQLVSLGHSVLESFDIDETLDLVRSVPDIRFLVSDVVEVRSICNVSYLVSDQANSSQREGDPKSDRKAIKISQISGYADGLSCQNFADCLSFTVQENDGINETIHMRLQ